jgi:polynucleotide 5'-hydroxyl-kinase GRC3/NOL9
MIQEWGMEIPESWREAADGIAGEPGVTVVLGASDSGKTTFVEYCLGVLRTSGTAAAVVDADIGQSSVGPPTTVGLAVFDSGTDTGPPPWPAKEIQFVGGVSPPGHLLQLTVGTVRLAGRACALGAGSVLVDTTGLVHGNAALALKRAKLALVEPRHIAVLGGGECLDGIVAPFGSTSVVHRIEAHPSCRRRSLEERAANREALFKSYFSGSREVTMDLSGLFVMGHAAGLETGRLAGLAGEGDRTLALAAVTEACAERVTVRTPLSAADREKVKGLQLSDFALSL